MAKRKRRSDLNADTPISPSTTKTMKIHFRITGDLMLTITSDLSREHAFAYERVGFISVGFAECSDGILILAQDYHPVADENYILTEEMGALINSEAIRDAMGIST